MKDKGEYLLTFSMDRRRWFKRLFEAKKRHGLSVLNYMATYNLIRLLIRDNGSKNATTKSIQLIAAGMGQEFHQREKQKGAFEEDRYHATAMEAGAYLL